MSFIIPLEDLPSKDESTIRDQLWCIKSILEPAYRAAVENILESKEKARMEREAAWAKLLSVRKNRRP